MHTGMRYFFHKVRKLVSPGQANTFHLFHDRPFFHSYTILTDGN